MDGKSIVEATREVARVIARERTAAGILDGAAGVIAEAWDLPRVQGFFGPVSDAALGDGSVVFFDREAKTGGFIVEGASATVLTAISDLAAVVGDAVRCANDAELADRYRRLAEPLTDALAVYDYTVGRFVFANDAMTTLVGYTREELGSLAKPIWTHPSNAFLERVFAIRAAAFLRGDRRGYVDEVELECKDGSSVWTEVRSHLVKDEVTAHVLICAASCVLASSTQVEGQATLLEELQELANIGAWSIDAVTGAGHWTNQLSKIHEVGTSNVIAESVSNFTPETLGEVAYQIANVTDTRAPTTIEVPLTTRNGHHKWIRIHASAVVEHGQVVRVRGTSQDITQMKRAEIELAARRAQLQSLLDHLPDIVSLRDLEHRLLACNARFERLLGVGPGELLGKVVDSAAVEGPISRSIRSEQWLTFADDGHSELVETLTAPVRDADGKTVAILGIGRDITTARAAEEQLRAVQKMEAIGRLAGGVAHDFNNLLSVILSYTDLAMEALPEAHPMREDLGEILAAGKRGVGLTKQLLAFSRRQLLHMAPLVLADVVDAVGAKFRRTISDNIDLRINRAGEAVTTKVDRVQIEQVIMSIAVNARDAMPSGGHLTIMTSSLVLDDIRASALDLPKGDYVELSVQDTGTGMDQATLARVFEPFFTTKSVGKGKGLGLAMAYGIIRQSGGAIAIESIPGAGTTVRVFLPQHLAPVEQAAARPQLEPKVRGHQTVLVVEDEGPLRTVARRVLRGAGYEVLTAANAEEAIQIAHEVGDRIDILFTDVVMPGMNGGELAERLVALYPRMKVVLTSGYTDEKLARSGVGEHRFLPKPYEPIQLTSTIRAVLGDK